MLKLKRDFQYFKGRNGHSLMYSLSFWGKNQNPLNPFYAYKISDPLFSVVAKDLKTVFFMKTTVFCFNNKTLVLVFNSAN